PSPRSSNTAALRRRCATAEGARLNTPSDRRAFSRSGVLGWVRLWFWGLEVGSLACSLLLPFWPCCRPVHPAHRGCFPAVVSQKRGEHVRRCLYGVISYKFIPVGQAPFLSRVGLHRLVESAPNSSHAFVICAVNCLDFS